MGCVLLIPPLVCVRVRVCAHAHACLCVCTHAHARVAMPRYEPCHLSQTPNAVIRQWHTPYCTLGCTPVSAGSSGPKERDLLQAAPLAIRRRSVALAHCKTARPNGSLFGQASHAQIVHWGQIPVMVTQMSWLEFLVNMAEIGIWLGQKFG